MNPQIRAFANTDRVIHEPGRLMIVALLSAVEKADFLYLLHETGISKGTLSSRPADAPIGNAFSDSGWAVAKRSSCR